MIQTMLKSGVLLLPLAPGEPTAGSRGEAGATGEGREGVAGVVVVATVAGADVGSELVVVFVVMGLSGRGWL